MKYYIRENTTYEVEADSPKEALESFLAELKTFWPITNCEVHDRETYDADQNDVTEEAEAQQ